jgi:hypothetical protein
MLPEMWNPLSAPVSVRFSKNAPSHVDREADFFDFIFGDFVEIVRFAVMEDAHHDGVDCVSTGGAQDVVWPRLSHAPRPSRRVLRRLNEADATYHVM